MRCEICHREYINLGVHLRHKHKVDPDEYRVEHGMLMATPLVDEWLSKRISDSQISRLKDPEYKSEMTEKCLANAKKNIGFKGWGMTEAGKKSIANADKIRNDKYLESQAVVIAQVLREKGTMLDVRRATGSGPTAAKKMAKIAGVEYSKESAKTIRDARAAATTRAKAMARVESAMRFFYTTKSIAEMCRQAGITVKTYKNWRAAGLIQKHPNSRSVTQ